MRIGARRARPRPSPEGAPATRPLVRRAVEVGRPHGPDGRSHAGAPGRPRSAGPGRRRFVIDVREVTKTYQLGQIRVPALRGITLRIERGDYVAIMGSSGSGKSTLMNILGCLDLPTTGAYRLDGIDVRQFEPDELADVRNRKIGFVFQTYNLVPRATALSNVELPLAYAGLGRADRRARALRALQAVGLGDRARHQPSELSGGQQQRAAVARAIVTNPALVLADEPTGNLDNASTAEILRVFGRLNASGRTVVLITHEADVAGRAKRIVTLSDGLVTTDERVAPVTGPPSREGLR
ncbi:MAG: ABC transporter ATP-binding protein [Actinobacteria bacterium]|nr:MAG: ABC transporter ATP-binding protein [Actinomycetota bacterium]